MKGSLILIGFAAVSCSTPSSPNLGTISSATEVASVTDSVGKGLPRSYWPLDLVKKQSQIRLTKPPHCLVTVITECLNDSAVVNPITLDTGPGLDISHNYESSIYIAPASHARQHERLSKAIFKYNPIAQKLGPLSTLVLSHTAFVGYQAPEFRFTTRLGVPDSDIFVEGEVALIPNQGLHLVTVHEQAGLE
jgi:hypothetical protein